MDHMRPHIQNRLNEASELKARMASDPIILDALLQMGALLTACFRQGGRVWFCGNGGSAGDAQHIAAELSGRFYFNRPALGAEALHVNSSFVTAVGNDFGFDAVFARAIEGLGRKGDVLVGISTSGNSPNVIQAVEKAQSMGLHTAALTGALGGRLAQLCPLTLRSPSTDTARIQEGHILLGHLLCEIVEEEMFGHLNPKKRPAT